MKTGFSDMLKPAFTNKEVTVATVCGGTLLPAMEGLLKDRHAVTNQLGMPALAAQISSVTNAPINNNAYTENPPVTPNS